jgi:hypothetical protein
MVRNPKQAGHIVIVRPTEDETVEHLEANSPEVARQTVA